MRKKKADTKSFKATVLAVKKEMAKPRTAKSARGKETKLEARKQFQSFLEK